MKKLLVISLIVLSGCVSITTRTGVAPDGTKYLEQNAYSMWGGFLKEGAMDFRWESDGNVVVSGTNAQNMQTPNTVQDLTGLMNSIGGLLVPQVTQGTGQAP